MLLTFLQNVILFIKFKAFWTYFVIFSIVFVCKHRDFLKLFSTNTSQVLRPAFFMVRANYSSRPIEIPPCKSKLIFHLLKILDPLYHGTVSLKKVINNPIRLVSIQCGG